MTSNGRGNGALANSCTPLNLARDSSEDVYLHSLQPLDKEWVTERLSKPPFVEIEGVINVRTLGGYACKVKLAGSAEPVHMVTRPKFLYRSGEVSGITEKGKAQLRELNITTIYDLRSDTEVTKYNTPPPVIEGVEVLHAPVFKTEDYSPEVMARRYQLYASGKTEAFMELYSQMLDNGGPAFATVLRHVRDKPSEGCLFHCTAGKDRTAVIAAILLTIAGVDAEVIAYDYELTRIGREPIRDRIMKRLSQEPIFAANKDAALNMLSSRRETMFAFLDLLRDKYGGAESFVQTYCGMSAEDVETIRRNLVVPP